MTWHGTRRGESAQWWACHLPRRLNKKTEPRVETRSLVLQTFHLSQPFSTDLRACAMMIPTRNRQRDVQTPIPWRRRASWSSCSSACAPVGTTAAAAPSTAAEAAPALATCVRAARGADTKALPIDENSRKPASSTAPVRMKDRGAAISLEAETKKGAMGL